MQSEKWQQVSRIFEGALALEAEERSAYLQNQCGQDESLRREVELLINSHQKAVAEDFISRNAIEEVAPLIIADEMEREKEHQLVKGQEVGHYRVIERIGAGGMGEVYLAKDKQLDRTVALKILPTEVASDQRRMQRFRQEARIVSALNQPNIVTIFEFGETDSLQFIVSEYVDGKTLRDYMHDKKLTLHEILDIGVQVTAALEAAHEAKIMHRDIKPENIMIRRRDGVVKVLDFGLAKVAEKLVSSVQSTDTEAATEMLTRPGSLMGTINYMSPEQAQVQRVDERTDIWSTGVVLYEMAAGGLPFRGQTSSHTVVDILEKEPAALKDVPAEFERIVRKTLAKNPRERYQTARDLLIDLKNFRKRLEIDAELERSISPLPEKNAVAGVQTQPHSSNRKILVPILISAAVVGLLAIGFGVWSSSSSNTLPAASAPAPAPALQLNYWVTVQKYRDGSPYEDPFRVPGEMIFEKDYRVRLNVSTPQAGYLYILNEGPSAGESLTILFPSSTANSGSPKLVENQQVQIPEDGWFQFDDQRGTEKLWLIFSPTAVSELEAVKSFANKRDRGEIKNPDLNKAAKAFIVTNSVTKPSVEKIDDRQETSVRSSANVIVHLIKLEHR